MPASYVIPVTEVAEGYNDYLIAREVQAARDALPVRVPNGAGESADR